MSVTIPSRTPTPPARRGLDLHHPWIALLVAITVVALVAGGIWIVRSGSNNPAASPAPGAAVQPPSLAPTTPPSAPAASTPATTPPSATGSPSTGTSAPPSAEFRFAPLWPFDSVASAIGWQREASSGGHQPWRLDAASTAISFAHDYLGYSEITRAVSTELSGDQAWIGVAGTPAEGANRAVAVLHLARIGGGDAASRPWEVVGTRDGRLTLTAPRYGSTVGRTFEVGGKISGVDESLDVQVRSMSGGLLGSVGKIPAGGAAQPWKASVTVVTNRSGLATVAVSTGGHLTRVEGFAITAVQIRSG